MNFGAIFGGLSKLAAIAQGVAALLPVARTAVAEAETALGPGTGSAKLAMVEGVLSSVYAVEQTAVATWNDIRPAILGVVEAIVAAYKSVKPAAAATPAA